LIAFLEGTVAVQDEGRLVVQTGGVGLEVWVPSGTHAAVRIGDNVRLHTHFAVREDAMTLYGFHDPQLLQVFRLLLNVSGVGPKVALAVVSHLPLAVIAQAVAGEDAALLASAPGVGKKTAERMLLDLQSSLPDELLAQAGGGAASDAGSAAGAVTAAAQDATDALVALGYKEVRVKTLLHALAAEHPNDAAEALIRRALAELK
jgi:Holliday junction DNA helicase RuvA